MLQTMARLERDGQKEHGQDHDQMVFKMHELEMAMKRNKEYVDEERLRLGRLGIGAVLVSIRGLVLHYKCETQDYRGLNGEYVQSGQMFDEIPFYVKVQDESIAMWCSISPRMSAWCIGPKTKVGTDKMWAYMTFEGHDSCVVDGISMFSWTVHSYTSDSWELQTNVEVLDIDHIHDTQTKMEMYGRDGIASLGLSMQQDSSQDSSIEMYPAASQPELALHWDHEDSTAHLHKPSGLEIRNFMDRGASVSVSASISKFENELQLQIDNNAEKIAAVEANKELPEMTKKSKVHALKIQARIITKQRNLSMLNRLSKTLRGIMTAFGQGFRGHIDRYIGKFKVRVDLKTALYKEPNYTASWREIRQLEPILDEAKNAIQVLVQEENKLLDALENVIKLSEKTMTQDVKKFEVDLLEYQSNLVGMLTSHPKQHPQSLLEEASSLKSRLREWDAHAKEQLRGTAWIDFDDDDQNGRVEYVGHVIKAPDLDVEVEDGLGCMAWVDGTTYSGEFSNGNVEGIGSETYLDGSTYQGQFEKGTRHGLGVLRSTTGESYSGEWVNGERHGFGILNIPNHDSMALDSRFHDSRFQDSYNLESNDFSVFFKFSEGDMEDEVDNTVEQEKLARQIQDLVQDAQHILAMANTLAAQIRDKISQTHHKALTEQDMHTYFFAALTGPTLDNLESSGLLEDAVLDEPDVRVHVSLETWLGTVLIPRDDASTRAATARRGASSVAASRPPSVAASRAPRSTSLHAAQGQHAGNQHQKQEHPLELDLMSLEGKSDRWARLQVICDVMRSWGYKSPKDLLSLLEHREQFAKLAGDCGLEEGQWTIVWKAMVDLNQDVLESNPLAHPDAITLLEALFEKFCDTDKPLGSPYISVEGLTSLLSFFNITPSSSVINDIIESFGCDRPVIDIRQFLGRINHPDIHKWHRLAQTHLDQIWKKKARETDSKANIVLPGKRKEMLNKVIARKKAEQDKIREHKVKLMRKKALGAAKAAPRVRGHMVQGSQVRDPLLSMSWLEVTLALIHKRHDDIKIHDVISLAPT